ncbi:MAG: hypothetical protein MJ239_07350 [Bacilli bacterium]|nr:hypothetical protein [Bacilli bacterium]
MKETTNYKKLEQIYEKNGGYITRKDVDEAGIQSWFLYDFVARRKMIKTAPGIYTDREFLTDDYSVLQKRFSKYIFCGVSALYLLGLTDLVPTFMEVCGPQGYHPSRKKIENVIIHSVSKKELYEAGITEAVTLLGNTVKVYDAERTVCELIKNRKDYDGEMFTKAIWLYLKKYGDQPKLFRTAALLGVSKEVFEVFELIVNA